jgi:hypothetical protein
LAILYSFGAFLRSLTREGRAATQPEIAEPVIQGLDLSNDTRKIDASSTTPVLEPTESSRIARE